MKSLGWTFGFAFALLAAAGTYAAQKAIQMKPGTGLAFGRFDVSESEIAVDGVHLIRIKPSKIYFFGFGVKPWESSTITYTDGAFFAPNLKPGTYVVAGFRSGDFIFNLEDAYKDNVFDVAPGGISYAGTYKLRAEKERLFRGPKGNFERADSVDDETALLRWLSGELNGSGWSAPVIERLKQRLPAQSREPKTVQATGRSAPLNQTVISAR